MRIITISLSFFLLVNCNAQQFRYDNVKYNTVYPEDLCKELAAHPDHILLDVRSNGEYYDTLSSSQGLNIGHLKNAIHINISELAKRWKELEKYKDKPVFIYCSHSQRSRRASRMLADSGFVNIFNVNGGMTRLLMVRNTLPECFKNLYETELPYTIISPAEFSNMSSTKNPFYIIDLRADSIFNGISLVEKRNTTGRFKEAVNISYQTLETVLSKIPKDRPLLLVDDYGDESPEAAKLLLEKGYQQVNILFGGMDSWMDYVINISKKNESQWLMNDKNKAVTLLSAEKLDLLEKKEKPFLIDIRPADHFNNKSKNYWENIGRIKTAVNIPFDEIDSKLSILPPSKNTMLVLYTFNDQPEVYESAQKLKKMGYKNVNILYGGIWNLRWAGHNLKDKAYLSNWVVDIPSENQ